MSSRPTCAVQDDLIGQVAKLIAARTHSAFARAAGLASKQ
jgi:hypothetical protein